MRILWIALLFSSPIWAQEFRAQVVVDASRINQTNTEIFKNLENQLIAFINNTSFSGRNILERHRIPVTFYLNISAYEDNLFEASLQIQSDRPVYNSNYNTPLVLIKDPTVNFTYQEFAPLVLNENTLETNLVAVFGYYAWMLIGIDADTYAFNGGAPYYSKAQGIMALAQSRGFSGWTLSNREYNRVMFLNLLSSNESLLFKKAMYEYHFSGLDRLTIEPKLAKENMVKAIEFLVSFGNNGTHRTLVQGFFDAKAKEIHDVFSSGPPVVVTSLKKSLQRLAPLFGNYWSDIN